MKYSLLRWPALLLLAGLFSRPSQAHLGTRIAVDKQGRVWFMDAVGNRLWRIETDGRLVLVARGIHSNLLVLGREGEIYVRNDNSTAGAPAGLLRVDAQGRVTPVADPRVIAELAEPALPKGTPLTKVNSIAWAPDGSSYVRECGVIRRVASNGSVIELVGGGTAGSLGDQEDCTRVVGMAVDSAGNLYVANYGQAAVYQLTPEGKARVVLRSAWPWVPVGVTHAGEFTYVVERYGSPYVASAVLGSLPGLKLRVRKIASDGKVALLAEVR
jgi:sugar lactone lactonase YvrE